jgi:uncharacterized protein YggE
MTINNLKELSKLIDLCRKKGIADMSISGISFKLGDAPAAIGAAPEAEVKTESTFTDEDLMMWSATPHG